MPNPTPRYPSFLSASSAAGLTNVVQQGLATAEQLLGETVQFRRMVNGAMVNVGPPVGLILISFEISELRNTTGTPVQETSSEGRINLWEGDFTDLRVGDRFIYKEKVCEVSAVYPPSFGFVVAEVTLKQ